MNNGAPGASSPERPAARAVSRPQFGLFLSFAEKLFIQLGCLAGVTALVYLNLLMGMEQVKHCSMPPPSWNSETAAA